MNSINGFTFYKSYYECLTGLEQKDKEQILYAILEYVFEDKEPTFDDFKKTIWILIKPNLTTSKNKSSNAQKAADDKQKEIKSKSNQNQIEISKKHSPQEEDKEEDDDKELDKEYINNKKENIKRKKFIKPTVEEIKEYCQKRNNGVDAQKVYDYYDSNNWCDSKGNKVNNWKQKIIANWEDKVKKENKPDWLNKDIKEKSLTKEEKKEMEDLLKGFK